MLSRLFSADKPLSTPTFCLENFPPCGSGWDTFPPHPQLLQKLSRPDTAHSALTAKKRPVVVHKELRIQFQGDKDLGQGRFDQARGIGLQQLFSLSGFLLISETSSTAFPSIQ